MMSDGYRWREVPSFKNSCVRLRDDRILKVQLPLSMKRLISSSLIGSLCLSTLVFSQNSPKWVSASNGSIPGGAFQGGFYQDGLAPRNSLYVARAAYRNGIHPGKIGSGFRGCNIGYGGMEIEIRSYEVLQAPSGYFEWIRASNGVIPPYAWQAGQEQGRSLYIARARYNNGVHPGKIRSDFKACNIGWGGTEIEIASYEVLCVRQSASATPTSSLRTREANRSAERRPAVQQVNGYNVKYVQYRGEFGIGTFAEMGSKSWVENSGAGRTFHFRETSRDEWSVYLLELSQNVSVQIDLYKKEIYIHWDKPNRRKLYEIISAKITNREVTTVAPSDGNITGFTRVGEENTAYFINGFADVAYGADGAYAYKYNQSGWVNFDNATFGDPVPGVYKSGYVRAIRSGIRSSDVSTGNSGTSHNGTAPQDIQPRVIRLPDAVFASWERPSGVQTGPLSGNKIQFINPAQILDGDNRLYYIESITKPGVYYKIVASCNNQYIIITLGDEYIGSNNAITLSFDPNNTYNSFDEAMNGKNTILQSFYKVE